MPLGNAIVGVYDHPPPEGSEIEAVFIEPETADYDLWSREGIKTARAVTRLHDWVTSLVP